MTKPTIPPIPTIRENDPPVHLINSHGETLRSSNGNPRLACVCMALSFPLIEQEMIRRGLIKRTIDVFQGGYNPGVSASAGTHDMGGVIDVAQGQSREERGVWADFGVMMFPRTRQYGWRGGEHGHGVWHGCVHRMPETAKQARDGIVGLDGLASNIRRNFVAPSRTWQDAYLATLPTTPATPHVIDQGEDPVPELRERHYVIDHDGIDFQAHPDHPAIGPDVIGPIIYGAEATITGPEGATLTTRWAVLDRKTGVWTYRSDPVDHATHRAYAAIDNRHTGGDPEVSIFLDVLSDKAGPILVEQYAKFWKKS